MEGVVCLTSDGGIGQATGRILCFLSGGDPGSLKGDPILLTGSLILGEEGYYFSGTPVELGEWSVVAPPESAGIESPALPEVSPLGRLVEWRERKWGDAAPNRSLILNAILASSNRLSPRSAGLLKALLFGLRETLEPSLYEGFRLGGVLHILALSGMHLGLIAGILGGMLYPVLGKRWGFVTLSLFVCGYLYLTGIKLSLLRAGVMFFLLGFARWIGRRTTLLRALGWAALVSLLYNPTSIREAGFQLSFGALAGIALFGRKLAHHLGSIIPTRIGRWFGQAVGISVGAQLATAPILLLSFGELVPLGFLTGIVVTPVVVAFLVCGMIFLLIAPVAPLVIVDFMPLVLDHIYRAVEQLVAKTTLLPPWTPSSEVIVYGLSGAVVLCAILVALGRRDGKAELRLTRIDSSFS